MKVGVFVGVETQGWGVSNFVNAAKTIQSEGADTLLFKVSDGADGDPTFVPINAAGLEICAAIKAAGITPIPYLFAYGNEFGGLAHECAIANKYLDAGYAFCYDMESVFDGQSAALGQQYESLTHNPFYVSTWANVVDHNWHSMIQGLGMKVKFFMPQVYTSYDLRVYLAQYQLCGIPPTRISPTFTAQNIAESAKYQQQGVSLWEIMGLSAADVEEAVKLVTPPAPAPNMEFEKEAQTVWVSFFNTIKEPAPPTGTGIYKAWHDRWLNSGKCLGPAQSAEYPCNDKNGTALIFQDFSGCHAEHNPATQETNFIGPSGPL